MGTAFFVVLISATAAAGSLEEPAYRLDEIVVTAARLPYPTSESPFTVSVLGGPKLRLSAAADPADLLRRLGTVRVTRYGGLGAEAGLHMGGMSTVHTLVLLDGRPVNSPDVGTPDLGQIWLEGIRKVEALSGSASSLYGPGALSGVVNFISKPSSERWDVLPQFRLGTWRTARASLWLGGPLGGHAVSGGGAVTTTHGHRPNSSHTGRDLKLQLETHRATLRAGWHEEASGSAGPRPPADSLLWTPTQKVLGNDEVSSLTDRLRKESVYADVSVAIGIAKLNAYWQQWDRSFDQQYVEQLWMPDPVYARHFVDADHRSGRASAELRADLVHGTTFVSGSVWLSQDTYEADMADADAFAGETSVTRLDGDRGSHAALLHAGSAVGLLTLDGGIRWDNPSDLSAQISPRAALLAALGPAVSARASIGRGYRSPTLADLHWPSDPWSQGNPELEEEESWTSEAGVAVAVGSIEAELCFQHRDVTNLIQWAPTGPPNDWGTPKWQPSNVAQMNSETVVLQMNAAGRMGTLGASYELCRARRTADEISNGFTYATERRERRAPFQPEHTVTVTWATPPWRGWELAVSAEAASDMVNYYTDWASMSFETGAVATKEKTLPAYGTLTAKLSTSLGQNRLYIEADNILDASYATQFGDLDDRDYPMPGRCITVGLEVGLLK